MNLLISQKEFTDRLYWFLNNRPDLASLVSKWGEKGKDEKHLLSLLRGHRMKRILYRMLDENEFLSDHGLRALSKYHEAHPYILQIDDNWFSIHYTPGESDTTLFGGNSNWRGPVWMPMNFLLIESLKRFHDYYGDDFRIEYPTHSGNLFSLKEISEKLTERLFHCLQEMPMEIVPFTATSLFSKKILISKTISCFLNISMAIRERAWVLHTRQAGQALLRGLLMSR